MKIDARGQLCPQPVIMTKKALESGATQVEVTVDNAVAKENVSRFLQSQNFVTTVTEEDGNFLISAFPQGASPSDLKEKEPKPTPPAVGSGVGALLLSHNKLGGDDAELGEALMKTFVSTLAQLTNKPKTVCLMNEGVKLALKDSGTAAAFEEYIASGGKLLVCGACLKHFGLEGATVGTVSNMFEIMEALTSTTPMIL